MSTLKLDHIFCFCEPEGIREVKKCAEIGLTVTDKREHLGQGTANRCIMFNENYLELIFLNNINEAVSNQLRLEKRAYWKKTGSG